MSEAARAQPAVPNIPTELTLCPQWVAWLSATGQDKRFTLPNGYLTKKPLKKQNKPHKLPINPHTGGLADTTKKETWGTFPEALDAMWRHRLSGVGFVFADEDPYTGIDIDNCRNAETGEIQPWAKKIINDLSSYTEVSPSQCGVKITIRGIKIPPGVGNQAVYENGKVEVFSRARYFTYTGSHLDGTPVTIEDRCREFTALHSQLFARRNGHKPHENDTAKTDLASISDVELLERAQSARNGRKFQQLWTGDWQGAYPSQSEADLALCCLLAFWTNNDAARIESLFERSGLMRDKWAQPDYRRRTIEKAIEQTAVTYAWSAGQHRTATNSGVHPINAKPDWNSDLILNADGTPKALLANAITALRYGPEFHGVLGFNELTQATVALKPPPWPHAIAGAEWTDHEDRLTADWLQHNRIYVRVEAAGQAVQVVARDRQFHPVREYLDSLSWDGIKRIDTWLSVYCGVESTHYAEAVGARWLISAVARIYQPGAKVDCALILEGLQGIGKSRALRVLGGDWFTDEIADLGSKDAAMQTRGVWIIEIAELESISRSEVGRIKDFMSRCADRFRPPYGKHLIVCPRQCVFAGSVNRSTYLRDETGGRRFWPVSCTRIHLPELQRDRDQLWAEAVMCYRNGAVWWLESAELNRLAEEEQTDRYEGDPWEPRITEFVAAVDTVSIDEVLERCIMKKADQWTQGDQTRVAKCLRTLGWTRYRCSATGPGEKRPYRYRSPQFSLRF